MKCLKPFLQVLLLYELWSGALGVTYKPLTTHQSRDDSLHFQDYGTELIFENQVLPEDVEVTIYIKRNQIRKLIFLIDLDARATSVTVTPCGQTIGWRLLRRNFRTYHDDDKPRFNQVTHTVDLPVTEASYIGQERRTFFRDKMPIGLYVLELETREDDTSLRIYLNTKSKPQSPYPLLPEEEKVHVLKIRRDSAMVSWRSSPSSKILKNSIEYCVTANAQRNFYTMCEVTGEMKRDLYHPGVSYSRLALRDHSVPRLVTPMQCTGPRTWQVFRGLKEGHHYFFDVFVVNKMTNASSVYKGASAVTKTKSEDVTRLKHNAMTTMFMNSSNSYSATLKVNMDKNQLKSWLFVQSCSGPGPVTVKVSLGKIVVLDVRVMDYKTIELKNLSNGTYSFTVLSSVKVNRTARMWYSRKYHRFPFPSPPEDRRIKVFDTLTTCQSVTLSWKTSEQEKVRYCLYKRPTSSSVKVWSQNSCDNKSGAWNNKTRILCRRYHRYSKHRFGDVIIQEVTGLVPSRTYIFDVFLAKVRGKALPYDSVWVTTSQNCTPNQTHVRT